MLTLFDRVFNILLLISKKNVSGKKRIGLNSALMSLILINHIKLRTYLHIVSIILSMASFYSEKFLMLSENSYHE